MEDENHDDEEQVDGDDGDEDDEEREDGGRRDEEDTPPPESRSTHTWKSSSSNWERVNMHLNRIESRLSLIHDNVDTILRVLASNDIWKRNPFNVFDSAPRC